MFASLQIRYVELVDHVDGLRQILVLEASALRIFKATELSFSCQVAARQKRVCSSRSGALVDTSCILWSISRHGKYEVLKL